MTPSVSARLAKSEFYGDEEYNEDEISDFEEMDDLDSDNYKF